MQEFTVKYLLSEDQVKRLERIIIAYQAKGADFQNVQKLFEALMVLGCDKDINSRIDYAETNSGAKGA